MADAVGPAGKAAGPDTHNMMLGESPRDAILAGSYPPKLGAPAHPSLSKGGATSDGRRHQGGLALGLGRPPNKPLDGTLPGDAASLDVTAFNTLLTPNSFNELFKPGDPAALGSNAGSAARALQGPTAGVPPETLALLQKLHNSLEGRPAPDLTSPYWYHTEAQAPQVLNAPRPVVLDTLAPMSLAPGGHAHAQAHAQAQAQSQSLSPQGKTAKAGPGRPSKAMLAERARVKELATHAAPGDPGTAPQAGALASLAVPEARLPDAEASQGSTVLGGKRPLGDEAGSPLDGAPLGPSAPRAAARTPGSKRHSHGGGQGDLGLHGVRMKKRGDVVSFVAEVKDAAGRVLWTAPFAAVLEAARAYDAQAARLLGPEAPLNFPSVALNEAAGPGAAAAGLAGLPSGYGAQIPSWRAEDASGASADLTYAPPVARLKRTHSENAGITARDPIAQHRPSAPSALPPGVPARGQGYPLWALAPPGEASMQEWAEDEEEAFVREFPAIRIDMADMDKVRGAVDGVYVCSSPRRYVLPHGLAGAWRKAPPIRLSFIFPLLYGPYPRRAPPSAPPLRWPTRWTRTKRRRSWTRGPGTRAHRTRSGPSTARAWRTKGAGDRRGHVAPCAWRHVAPSATNPTTGCRRVRTPPPPPMF